MNTYFGLRKWDKNIDFHFPTREYGEQILSNFLRIRNFRRAEGLKPQATNFFDFGINEILVLSIVKKLRKKYPYEPIDYSADKKLYDEYFEMENCINSFDELIDKVEKEDVYLTVFRTDSPIKGEEFNSYFVNSKGYDGKYVVLIPKGQELKGSYHNEKYFKTSCGGSVSTEFFTNSLYSTEDEINEHLEHKKKYDLVTKEIDEAQKVVADLYEKRGNL
jgi:hypothetical protein